MPPPDTNSGSDDALLATAELLPRARAGDAQARQELFLRFAPPLRRFLHARLPGGARSLAETDDLVQEVCMSALGALDRFEHRGPGSFWAYLRRIGLNAVARFARRAPLEPSPGLEPDGIAAMDAPEAGQLGRMVEEERFSAFEKALEVLSPRQREALLLRLELNLSYQAIALECEFPSADAARVAVCRSIERVVTSMSRDGHTE